MSALFKKYSLTSEVEKYLQLIFSQSNIDLSKNKNITKKIITLSDLYQNELSDHSNIWDNKNHTEAYLIYFLILNTIRMTAVLTEVQKHLDLKNIDSFVDFGSGPGTAHLALLNMNLKPKILNFDSSASALSIHEGWANRLSAHFTSNLDSIKPLPNQMAIFSYSYNEFSKIPELVNKFDHILIIEPSNQTPARRLQKLRSDFIKNYDYKAIAPCTHQLDCPLLKHSKKDWCHNRIFIDKPDWFNNIETLLPMKNNNLTYSYLFLSKKIMPNSNPNIGRLIGDTLKEKGKSRQAICRNEDREFLSWLKKNGPVDQLERGTQFEINDQYQKKGNELRKN